MLPYLKPVQNPSKKYVTAFRGLNCGEGMQDGEFADTYNLSSEQFPCITQRAARIKAKEYANPTTLHSKGNLLVIDGTDVYYGDNKVGEVTEGKKQTATIGNYIVIFPDKKYYKVPTEDDQDGEFGEMQATCKVSGVSISTTSISTVTTFTRQKLHFTNSTISIITGDSKNPPFFPFKTGDAVTITRCNWEENLKEEPIIIREATETKITFDENTFSKSGTIPDGTEVTIVRKVDVKFPFRKGDAVAITGCTNEENNKAEEVIIRGVTEDELTFDDNTFTEAVDNAEITITRTIPDLDFICESNFRLWGTHDNTIYASAWSDPLNFKVFEGLASDSYSIDVGSEGEFTGCIPYSSHICFFKENTLHKMYGSKPSNYQINTTNVYGVQSGSERSMHIVNEQLLYKGVNGVYAYTGGVPELISQNFGNKRYSDAVACCDGERYYISMKNGETYDLFTYDVMKNIWLREDDTHAVDMTFYKGKLYYLDAEGGLWYIDKTADRSDIEWGATFCTMHETMNERKGYSKFHLRTDLSAGAWLAVDIKTDNDQRWKQIYTTHNSKAKTISIPIIPTRCDSIDIRLRGKGKCTLKTFIREFTVGSDV